MTRSSVRGRLAPSPTGYLHLGNARSFLLAWLQVRALGGEIILRIEDVDAARAVQGADRAIVEDLAWLGLDWDNPLDGRFYQSQRLDNYTTALSNLHSRGLLYECFCSRRELDSIASAPHGVAGPRYPGTCREFGEREREQRRRTKQPALRLRIPDPCPVEFNDLVAGFQRTDLARSAGDFILARADGVIGYQLAVVVDDIAHGITHVLRGDDLLESTPRQIHLHRLLGNTPPHFAHVPLLLGTDGARLAKRHGAVSLAELRAAGADPQRVVGYLASSCGLRDVAEPCAPHELIAGFDLSRIGREPTVWRGEGEEWELPCTSRRCPNTPPTSSQSSRGTDDYPHSMAHPPPSVRHSGNARSVRQEGRNSHGRLDNDARQHSGTNVHNATDG